ncbi:MAG: glycosyltransferase family 4 protein [Alphaproteobacteria bacterium]|nr:glycosyltransferase family 4 protein [Alphaproteobacteria bacterium]
MTEAQTPKFTIIQIIPELGAGGAEQGCIDVAAGIVKAGGRAVIVSHGGLRIPELARIGAIHENLPVHSKNPFIMWQNIKRIEKLIKKYDAGIVHARSRAPAWSAWRACRNAKARFVTTCHAPYNISGQAKKIYNGSIAQGEIVIAISEFVAAYLQENYHLPPERIEIIPRGIPLERFHPAGVTAERLVILEKQWRIPDGANVVMLPGRLTRWKGHHVLIDAMEKLDRSDVFCVMIGADQGRENYRKELEDAISAKNLGSRVRIVDHCNDMPAAYMLATVVVSASTDPEGFGRVPAEAQAMGRPIIATNHGGARETIQRGYTGWLVEPNNPDDLAAALEEALSLDSRQRAILATRGMTHVANNFTREQMVEKTLHVYARLLNSTLDLKTAPEPFRGSPRSSSPFASLRAFG